MPQGEKLNFLPVYTEGNVHERCLTSVLHILVVGNMNYPIACSTCMIVQFSCHLSYLHQHVKMSYFPLYFLQEIVHLSFLYQHVRRSYFLKVFVSNSSSTEDIMKRWLLLYSGSIKLITVQPSYKM